MHVQRSRGCLLDSDDELHKLLRCICSSTRFQSPERVHNPRLWWQPRRENLPRDWKYTAHILIFSLKLRWKKSVKHPKLILRNWCSQPQLTSRVSPRYAAEAQGKCRVLAGGICWGRLQGNSPAANFSDCLTKCESLTLPRRCCVRVTGDLCDFNYPLWKPINEMWRAVE